MERPNHAQRAHALLSPSGASRWLNCTPSARLEDVVPDERTSTAANEGTLAHEFGEIMLRRAFPTSDVCTPSKIPTDAELLKHLPKMEHNELYYIGMLEDVRKYVQVCIDEFIELKTKGYNPNVIIEQRVTFYDVVTEGSGMADFSIFHDRGVKIIDLKFGKGVQVYAKDNPQLKLYGYGLVSNLDFMLAQSDEPLEFCGIIVQPRLNHIEAHYQTIDSLYEWAADFVKPRADKAYKGEGEQVVGDHCKFCKVKSTCRAQGDFVLKVFEQMEEAPKITDRTTLTDEELIKFYHGAKPAIDWLNSLTAYMTTRHLNGQPFEGLKVVEGRSLRRISNEEAVIADLSLTADEDDFLNKKLKALSELEKTFKGDVFDKIIAPHIKKPPGAPTLVPASDKRPDYNKPDAAAVFADLDQE